MININKSARVQNKVVKTIPQLYIKQQKRDMNTSIRQQCSHHSNKQNIDSSNIIQGYSDDQLCSKLAYTIDKAKLKQKIVPYIPIKNSAGKTSDNKLVKQRKCQNTQVMKDDEQSMMTQRYAQINTQNAIINQNIQTQRPVFNPKHNNLAISKQQQSRQNQQNGIQPQSNTTAQYYESAIQNLVKLDRGYLVPLMLLFDNFKMQAQLCQASFEVNNNNESEQQTQIETKIQISKENDNNGVLMNIVSQIQQNIVKISNKYRCKEDMISQFGTQTQDMLIPVISSQTSQEIQLMNRLSQIKKSAELQLQRQTQHFQTKLCEIIQAVYALKTTIQQLQNQEQTVVQDKQNINLQNNEHNLYHTPGAGVQSQTDHQGSVRHSLQRWKRQLELLLSAITCRDDKIKQLSQTEQALSIKNNTTVRQNAANDRKLSPDLNIDASVSDIKPFVVDSCVRNHHQQEHIGLTQSNASVCQQKQINENFMKSFQTTNSCFKQILAFALELLFYHLSQVQKGKKYAQELTKKSRHLYSQYKAMANNMKILASGKDMNKIEQLKTLITTMTQSVQSVRTTWMAAVRTKINIK